MCVCLYIYIHTRHARDTYKVHTGYIHERIQNDYNTIYTIYLLSFVETPRKFIIAELSIRKLGSSSVLIIRLLEFTRPFLYIKCRDCMLA